MYVHVWGMWGRVYATELEHTNCWSDNSLWRYFKLLFYRIIHSAWLHYYEDQTGGLVIAILSVKRILLSPPSSLPYLLKQYHVTCLPYLEIYLSKHLLWILNPLSWLILEISWRDKKDDGSSSVTGSGETKGCVVWASLGWPTSANYFLTKTITSHN